MDEVRWIRVPMASDAARTSTQIARGILAVGTLGISSALVKDLSHECLEFRTTCTKCGAEPWFTAEINRVGRRQGEKDFACGYYSREHNARHTYKPKYMTLQYA